MDTNISEQTAPRLFGERWVMMVLFMIMNGMHTMIYSMLGPLATFFEELYKVSPLTININSILMVILYVPSNFFVANYIYKRWGLWWTVTVGAILECACLWSRVLINVSFYIAMVGGFFYGVAQPLIQNSMSQLASNWFSTKERPVVIACSSLTGLLGGGLGFLVHIIFVKSSDVENKNYAEDQLFKMMLYSAIIISAIFTIVLIFFREKPPVPPTATASQEDDRSVRDVMKELLANKNYLLVMNGFAGVYSVMSTITQELSFVIEPFGFNSTDTGVFGMLFSSAGIFGSLQAAFIVGRTKKFRTMLFVVATGSLMSMLFIIATLDLHNLIISYIGIILFGFFMVAIFAVGLEYGCEVCYPVPAQYATGVMMSYSLLICTVQIIAASFIFNAFKSYKGSVYNRMVSAIYSMIIVLFLLGSMGCAALSNEDLRKSRIDEERRKMLTPS